MGLCVPTGIEPYLVRAPPQHTAALVANIHHIGAKLVELKSIFPEVRGVRVGVRVQSYKTLKP
jgi:hypothetical protein